MPGIDGAEISGHLAHPGEDALFGLDGFNFIPELPGEDVGGVAPAGDDVADFVAVHFAGVGVRRRTDRS